MPLPIIHINGFPGIGKLTIARHLTTLLAPYNAKLIHNHLLIDPAGAVLSRDSPDYQPLRRAIRTAVFNTLATSRDTFDSIYVFTDFQSDDEIGSGVMEEHKALAATRGCTLVPVHATCGTAENLRRLTSSERGMHGKLIDTELVAHIRESEVIYQWPAENPFQLELDLTELDAEAAARRIYQHVLDVCRDLKSIR